MAQDTEEPGSAREVRRSKCHSASGQKGNRSDGPQISTKVREPELGLWVMTF